MMAKAVPIPVPVPEPKSKPELVPTSVPAAPAVPFRTGAARSTPVVTFSAAPESLATARAAPPWDAPLCGVLLGLCLALLHILFRELVAGTFADARQARRMVNLPFLAALPAYDAKSFRTAAGAMRGETFGSKPGGMTFIPLPVDFAEPKPAARRNPMLPARRRPAVALWAAGVLLLGLAGALFRLSARGFAQPRVSFPGEMAVPPAGEPSDAGAGGNRP